MKIGIIETGHPPEGLAGSFPSYAGIVREALGPDFECETFDATAGQLPILPGSCRGFVITGSSASVNDPDAWIVRLEKWLRDLPADTPIVGFCFGHQILAKAHGGRVEQLPHGFTSGLRGYEVKDRHCWMDEASHVVLPAFNRDHVIAPPPGSATVLASNESPYAALAYRGRRAASFQNHPEYSLTFVARAIEWCERSGRFTAIEADRARASLSLADDCERVRRWVRAFLRDGAPLVHATENTGP